MQDIDQVVQTVDLVFQLVQRLQEGGLVPCQQPVLPAAAAPLLQLEKLFDQLPAAARVGQVPLQAKGPDAVYRNRQPSSRTGVNFSGSNGRTGSAGTVWGRIIFSIQTISYQCANLYPHLENRPTIR